MFQWPVGWLVLFILGKIKVVSTPKLHDAMKTRGDEGIASSVFFSFCFSGWGETESTWYVGHCWPIVPAPDDR
jgi:hypothetical protein